MFKEIFSHIEMGRIGEAGMLLFMAIFIAVTIHAISRRRAELDYWASLPLAGTNAMEESKDGQQA